MNSTTRFSIVLEISVLNEALVPWDKGANPLSDTSDALLEMMLLINCPGIKNVPVSVDLTFVEASAPREVKSFTATIEWPH